VPLKPLPDPATLASTIAGAATFQTSDSGPLFRDLVALGEGQSVLTVSATLAVDADQADSVGDIAGVTGNQFSLEVLRSTGAIRMTGTNLNITSAANVVTLGVQFDVVACIDRAAGTARAWVDGVEVINTTFALPGDFTSSRNVQFLARNTAGTDQIKGRVERLAAWLEATTDGTEPASAPYKEIAGGAAAVNADPWKSGTNAA
jgi:hypothetical protein